MLINQRIHTLQENFVVMVGKFNNTSRVPCYRPTHFKLEKALKDNYEIEIRDFGENSLNTKGMKKLNL